MKKKTLASIFALTAVATTVGTGMVSHGSISKDNSNNEVLLTQNEGNNKDNNSGNTNKNINHSNIQRLSDTNAEKSGSAVVINGDGSLVLMGSNTVKSNLVGYLSAGEMLTVHGQDGNWYKVTVQETGESGYIKTTNLQFIESGANAPLVNLNGTGRIINVSSDLIIRSNATMDSSVMGHLKNGNSIKIIGKQGQWYKVNDNGVIGFVYSNYVSASVVQLSTDRNVNGEDTTSVEGNINKEQGNKTTEIAKQASIASKTKSVKNEVLNTKVNSKEHNVTVNKLSQNNSKIYNEIYNIVKSKFWTNPNTDGSTMSMDMAHSYVKNGVKYYSVYIHTTNADNGTSKTTHYFISTNGTILDANAFKDSTTNLSEQQIKNDVTSVANEYLNDELGNNHLAYNVSLNKTMVKNGTTLYEVQVYYNSVAQSNYISTIYVSPFGQVISNLGNSNSKQEPNKQATTNEHTTNKVETNNNVNVQQNHLDKITENSTNKESKTSESTSNTQNKKSIVKRTRSTSDVQAKNNIQNAVNQ